eukprot:SAG31_NODE_2022_length_6645_cov_15.375191_3_plen_203_part_00
MHVAQSGLSACSNIYTWAAPVRTIGNGGAHADGAAPPPPPAAAEGIVHAKAEIMNGGKAPTSVCVKFTVIDSDGTVVATSATATPVAVPPGKSSYAEGSLTVKTPPLWSSSHPNLYTINASLHTGQCTAPAVDVVQEVHGFRSTRWDADDGFFLNEQHFKIRGCTHTIHTFFSVRALRVPPYHSCNEFTHMFNFASLRPLCK